MRKILFVDDELMVLQGIQRSLRSMRSEWEIRTATSAVEALALLQESHFDVVVSDMKMPGMDGARFLKEVKLHHPNVIRFVLSGQCDREEILRSVGPAHQFLTKPCDPAELKSKLARIFGISGLLDSAAIKSIISQLKSVPSLPTLYVDIMRELNAENGSGVGVAQIISQDPGMSAKILQLANSPLFGMRSQICDPLQAVNLLGFDTIRALALTLGVFAQFGSEDVPRFALESIRSHAVRSAVLAKAISAAENKDKVFQDHSFTAALLQDIGKLVLISGCTQLYKQCVQRQKEHELSDWEAELSQFGCTHGSIGAYLLGIWGLPQEIIETVAWHDRCHISTIDNFHPVVAVLGANMLLDSRISRTDGLGLSFLSRTGYGDRLATWSSLLPQEVSGEKACDGQNSIR